MGWLKSWRARRRGPPQDSGRPLSDVNSWRRPPSGGDDKARSSNQALSGYGNNPYDTYTWDLHAEPDQDRDLKRPGDASKRREGGDPSNPYDTSTFRGGWR
jgi:hypothetical protein